MGGFFPSNVDLAIFIRAVQGYGLPTRILEQVQSNYTIRRGDQAPDHVKPVLNILYLSPDTLTSVSDPRPELPFGEATGIQTVYHEATHAYLDIQSDAAGVSTVRETSVRHYRAAPLKGGEKADDPERLFDEAAGSYVGHRAAHWWFALERLTTVGRRLQTRNVGDRSRWIEFLKATPGKYDRAMAKRIFGYQETGVFGSKQVETTLEMPGLLKEFCDRVLLEGKIPDQFERAPRLRGMYKKLVGP